MSTDNGDAWRGNLGAVCKHRPDPDRNPDKRPGLCIKCRFEAGDPIARRMLQRRQQRRNDDGDNILKGQQLAHHLDALGVKRKPTPATKRKAAS